MSFSKRVLVILLSVVMAVTYLPALAFAADEGVAKETTQTEETINEDKSADPAAEEEPSVTEAEETYDTEGSIDDQNGSDKGNAEAGEEADSAAEKEVEQVSVTGPELSYSVDIEPEVELADNDELLMQFLDKEVSSEVPASRPGLLKASRATRGSKLTGNNAFVYNKLTAHVKDIAEGRQTRADKFSVPVTELDFTPDEYYTAADLKVDALFDGNSVTEDAYYAILNVLGYEPKKVVNALLADLPYEMYWFDKLVGANTIVNSISRVTVTYKDGTEEDAIKLNNAALVVKFTVAGGQYGYRSDENDEYSLNSDKVSAANAAAANASGIIKSHEEAKVYDRLDAYRQEILARNTYNHEAAAAPAEVYGDPWQMIYVFDGNTSTNAVCEGYSKAFQFLVDHTDFFSEKGIECYSILGKMFLRGRNLGSHMWNIVTMDDGKNYMADLTNCDTGSIGAPDKLFLKGCMPGGTVENGYEFDTDADDESDLLYTYSNQALSLYDAELVLSERDYQTPVTIVGLEFLRNGSSTIRIEAETEGYQDPESNYFRYGYAQDISKMFVDGDILRITYSDSETPVDFTYYENNEEYNGQKRFVHDNDDNTFNWYSYEAFEFSSNQKGEWEPGGTGYEFYITHINTDKSVKAVCPVEILPSKKPVYRWSDDNKTVTAEAPDPDDPNKKITETVNTTSEVISQASCESGSKVKYTAIFTNPAFETQTKTVTNNDALTHSMTKHALKKATDKQEGNIEYYECTGCKKLFRDEAGTDEITQKETVIPKVAAPKGRPVIRNTIANSAKKTNDVIWDKAGVTGATGYIVEWRARGGKTWAKRYAGNTIRSYTSGLTIGNLYEIQVTPYKAATATTEEVRGTSSEIVYRYFFTTQKIRLASRSKGTFTMSWAKDPKATGYQVLYTTNANGSGAAQNLKNIKASATSYTASTILVGSKSQKLKSGTTYYVQVREVRTVGGKNYIGNISCPVAVKVK